MQTQEVAIKPNLRVVLKSDAQLIDEVVVTGYGVTKKAAFTGSAQTVDNKDLMKKNRCKLYEVFGRISSWFTSK